MVYVKEVFGNKVTQRATGTPATEKNLENHRENSEILCGSLFLTLWLSV
ncbi:MAG: hypothetical protein RLZZ306_2145 [Bacteroidota bacterium]|jgi:hypothetical protein